VPVVFIARDTIVDATRMIASSKNIIIPANIFGKLKTMTMMISLVVVFFVLNSVDSTDLLYY
jgi:CDP-diacylglycerol--glycerol-3-phosphate 3-phosphatidyltransferase